MTTLSWMELLVGALVTFRLATMVAQEAGPGKVFEKTRKLPKTKTWRDGLQCPYCVSVYASSLVTTSYVALGWLSWQDALFTPLAFSALSVIMTRQWTKDL